MVSWYHQNLLNSPDALAWLEKRGLNHPELVSHFRLGFAGAHGVVGALPSPHAKGGKALLSRLTRLGVVRESTRQDHLRGCLIVPVGWALRITIRKAVAGCCSCTGAERWPTIKSTNGSPKHLYLPSPSPSWRRQPYHRQCKGKAVPIPW